MDAIFTTQFRTGWGDCDPAGLMFHPQAFRWLDATFQAFLVSREASQERLRGAFGAVGFGLVEAAGRFHKPLREGDPVSVSIIRLGWKARVLAVDYVGIGPGGRVLEGREIRALFVGENGRLKAQPLEAVRTLLGKAEGRSPKRPDTGRK